MRSLRDESGQALVVVALGLTTLLGFIGLAVDVGSLMHNKRELQVAADAAAIAAATSRNASGYVAAADNASTANGFTNGQNGVTVTVNPPPLHGEYTGQAGYIEVIVQKTEPTIFMGLFGHGSVPVSARAVAVAASSTGNGTGCVYTLGATGTDFLANGAANIQAPNCGLDIDSSSSGAMTVNGNITMDMASIGIVAATGGLSKNGNISLTPATPTPGIVPYSDPLSYLPGYTCTSSSCTPSAGGSNVSCVANPNYNGNTTTTVSPGCFDGLTFNGNSAVNLNPGTYIINGGLTFNGNNTITGTGVTFYVASGAVTMNGNTILNVSAPTSGTYSGMLFDQSSTDTSTATLNGNDSSNIQGIMYFPAASLIMNGNSSAVLYTDFIVSSLTLNGNIKFKDYASLGASVHSPITVVTLVE